MAFLHSLVEINLSGTIDYACKKQSANQHVHYIWKGKGNPCIFNKLAKRYLRNQQNQSCVQKIVRIAKSFSGDQVVALILFNLILVLKESDCKFNHKGE